MPFETLLWVRFRAMTSFSSADIMPDPRNAGRSPLVGLLVLLIVWVGIVAVVNPVGEFMVNDDWSFQRALENWVVHGRIQSTGWGPSSAPGGPSVVFHLAWGRLFQALFGASSTALRVSVLAMGVMGSLGLFLLLRQASASNGVALWATLTLMMNPLFLSQCFTFMTDITFTATAIFSLWFLYVGIKRERVALVVVGLLFALCSVLTRQVALVIPLAFVITCLVYRRELVIGPLPALLLTAGVVIVPWLCYEFLLFRTGGTPLTQHQVFQNLWHRALERPFLDYAAFLAENLLVVVLYVSFLISPVLALRYRELTNSRMFVVFFVAITAAAAATEAAIGLSLVKLPVTFARNVIFDLGLGPVLLKDTYVLKLHRGMALPSALYCLVVYGAVVSCGAMMCLIWRWLGRVLARERASELTGPAFLGTVCFLAGLMYVGGITLSGFHDRYLVIMCVLGTMWLMTLSPPGTVALRWSCGLCLGLVPLVAMGFFSIAGVHDFMAMKRALKGAQDYVVRDLGVPPCDFDGGMEFNGYHCYQPDFEPKPGLSWWWVHRETYLLTLGPLPGYETMRTFPFRRILGGEARVEVLKPDKAAAQ